ncbi:MAG: peptide-methionine (S)-S-oxide reductase, partial [Campylobacterales bacterium]|nr:peptide-methionine (S)-S-oxide reductase [Campylobacterales bacterium]
SAIFTSNKGEREIIQNIAKQLTSKGYNLATKLHEDAVFYKAEEYHQDYYQLRNQQPYCHSYTKRF